MVAGPDASEMPPALERGAGSRMLERPGVDLAGKQRNAVAREIGVFRPAAILSLALVNA